MNEYEVGKDIATLQARVAALEAKLQTRDCGCSGKHIELRGMAQETKEAPTPGISMREDPDADALSVADCTDGHLRQKMVNGVCYCQMCCGGRWLYFCWDNGRCVKCSDRPVTVNCAGRNLILDC